MKSSSKIEKKCSKGQKKVKVKELNPTEKVLFEIHKAQGLDPLYGMSYTRALKEIRQGRKTSHWIWYIWPCLQHLRPGTSRPEFLLPDLDAARAYLKEGVLRERLLEITTVAIDQIEEDKVAPRTLFGGGIDILDKIFKCLGKS